MTDILMTCAECDEIFLDYFERQLGDSRQRAMDSHVASCARCQGLVRDVEGIRRDAQSLPDLAPSRDLWKGIESRIQPTVRSIAGPRQHAQLSRTWMAAAAAALIVVSSSVTYVATKNGVTPAKPAGNTAATAKPVRVVGATVDAEPAPPPAATQETRAAEASKAPSRETLPSMPGRPSATRSAALASTASAVRRTDSEIAIADEITRLQALVSERSADMAPETMRVVQENLAIIDAAVRQARAAVERDPGSGFLSERLENALHKKVQLLRTVALLPAST